MPQPWNPNSPATIGLEHRGVGCDTKRVGSLVEQQIIRWRALAAGNLDTLSLSFAPGTATSQFPPGPAAPSQELVGDPGQTYNPNTASAAFSRPLLVEVVARANELQTVLGPASITVDEYAVSAVASPGIPGSTDTFTTQAGGAPAASSVQTRGDGNYLKSKSGAIGIHFASAGFSASKHVLGVEFVVVSKGAVYATIDTHSPTAWATGCWGPESASRSSEASEEWAFRLAEVRPMNAGVVNSYPTKWLTPAFVQSFATTTGQGARRLYLQTNGARFVDEAEIDYVLMRVYSIVERRLAVGVVAPAYMAGFVLTSAADGTWVDAAMTTPAGATFARVAGTDYSTIIRRAVPGNAAGYAPDPTGQLRRMVGASLANVAVRSAASVETAGPSYQITAVGDPEDALVAFRLRTAGVDQAETIPYRFAGVQVGGGGALLNPAVTAVYNVGYVLVACDPGAVRAIGTIVGTTTKTVAVTYADWLASPVAGTLAVAQADGSTRTLTFRRVRLDFGTGVTVNAGTGSVSIAPDGTLPGQVTEGVDAWYVTGYLHGDEAQSHNGATFDKNSVRRADIYVADSSGSAPADLLAVASQKPTAPTTLVGTKRRWPVARAGNLVADAGFEALPAVITDGLWGVSGPPTIETAIVETGTKALRLQVGAQAFQPKLPSGVGGRLRCSAGEVLELSARLYNVGGGIGSNPQLALHFRTTDDATVAAIAYTATITDLPVGAWATRTLRVAVPAGRHFVEVYVRGSITGGFSTTIADRVRLTRVGNDPAPPATTSLLPAGCPDPCDVDTFEAVQLTWGGQAAGVRYEVDRYDAVAGWERIGELAALAASFVDVEARFGVVNAYRVRAVRSADEVGSDAPEPPEDLLLAAPRSALVFASNAARDLAVAYYDVGAAAPPRAYSFEEAADVVVQAPYGADGQLVFRPTERRGTTFARTLSVPGRQTPTAGGPSPFEPLRRLAAAAVPYVAVRDAQGNRWLGGLVVPRGQIMEGRQRTLVEVSVVETVSGAAAATT